MHSLRGRPHVIDIRNIGLVAGIELESRPGQGGRARDGRVTSTASANGLLIRVTADTIALSPPLIIERAQVDRIVDGMPQALRRVD